MANIFTYRAMTIDLDQVADVNQDGPFIGPNRCVVLTMKDGSTETISHYKEANAFRRMLNAGCGNLHHSGKPYHLVSDREFNNGADEDGYLSR